MTRDLPTAVEAQGIWITDGDGKRYLDASGGAIVVNVGHGDLALIEAAQEQLGRTQYVHGSMFTTEALESYAEELAPLLPMDEPMIYPVSGGSEAVETALKMARAYHLARGEGSRVNAIARRSSYHGNTLGALDLSGKEPLRKPYTPWLGRFLHAPAAYEYRCENPLHPVGCGAWHAAELERMIHQAGGTQTVAAFVAEPVSGATLAAAVPTDDYWPLIVDVCRRHGILVIADEVMTGFGRTGRWFGVDNWDVRPDILTAGKGATSGYVPFGFAASSGEVFETVREGGFVHGFTWSHNALGASVGRAVIRRLKEGLLDRSGSIGANLLKRLSDELAEIPIVGDVRGIGTMIGVELVKDRRTKEPFVRAENVTERIVASAREAGMLIYSSTGHADGNNGDLVMLGPPFCLSDDEASIVVERTAASIRSVS